MAVGDHLRDGFDAPAGDLHTEATRRVIQGIFGFRDADYPMACMNAPGDFVFLSRVQLAVASVFASLGVTASARAIVDDMDAAIEPVTELGKLHHAWVRERGLPSALDHHDHP